MVSKQEFLAELLGTFLLVFFGLSTVAVAVTLNVHVGLFQVALLWGLALIVAISVSSEVCDAHFNPAITLAFATVSDFCWRKVPVYIFAQCSGSFLAALAVYALFSGTIEAFEENNHLIRGESGSELSSMMFGEYFPNPVMARGMSELSRVTLWHGFFAELLGTALLSFVIFTLVGQRRTIMPSWLIPILIGVALSVIIAIMAPLSMGGFNPARDLMPRIVASLTGWGRLPFEHNGNGWLIVYILAPILGAQVGAVLAQSIRKPSEEEAV